MDAAGTAPTRYQLVARNALLVLCLLGILPVWAQTSTVRQQLETIKTLFQQERWPEVVTAVQSLPEASRSADIDFYYGTALARLGRWDEARKAFLDGLELNPSDERFLVELAGVSFKQKDYRKATGYLRRALALKPQDEYGNQFLGTIYFLQGNLEAALKYWNRIGKPRVGRILMDPKPAVDPVLLDHAFAFSSASTLRLRDFLTTQQRLQGLQIFGYFNLSLQARDDGNFDLMFRNDERNGWGRNKWQALISIFLGIPGQTVTPEFYNIGDQAMNVISLVRWDSQKRRFQASMSAPYHRQAKRRYELGLDLRNENWQVRDSFEGPAPLLAGLNLRREAVNASLTTLEGGTWSWSAITEFSHRDYRDVFQSSSLTPNLLSQGFQLKETLRIDADLWRIPERRMTFTGGAAADVGRLWSSPSQAFTQLRATGGWHWLPLPDSDDYETRETLHIGKTLGEIPFDEQFMLGIGGDNDLLMRGHIATRNGRKGTAPLGRNYFLSNWELDKNVFRISLVNVKVGPFLDTGAISSDSPALGSHKWLWDTGVQAKAFGFGREVIFSYGKDLRSGNNAFYVSFR